MYQILVPEERKMSPAAAMIPCSSKRQRTMWSLDWASLDQDVLQLIGWRVLAGGDLHDYVRLRAVCKHWSWSTVSPGGRGLRDPRFQYPRRWMMLPEGHGLYPGHPGLRGFVRFFNLSTGAFVRAHLPLLRDHVVLDSVDGLLLVHRDMDYLLHGYPEALKRGPLRTLSASVSVTTTRSIIVMLFFSLLHRLAYATAGDWRWTLSDLKLSRPRFPRIILRLHERSVCCAGSQLGTVAALGSTTSSHFSASSTLCSVERCASRPRPVTMSQPLPADE
ncbi:hypothetical protein ACP70R_031703 [Stipagrostis hirtigluma subsp. patula]